MKSLFAICTSIVLCFGILTCWITEFWAIASFQCAFFILTAAWLILAIQNRVRVEFHWLLIPVSSVALLGAIQLISNVTVSPLNTSLSIITWICHASAMFLVLQFGTSLRVREAFLEGMLFFAAVVAILGVIQNFTSQGRIFWMFESGYKDLVLGPFVYRNKYAQFIELFLPVALFRAVGKPGSVTSSLMIAAMMLAGSVAGGSRSGVALAFLETIVVLIVIRQRGLIAGRRVLRLGLQVVLLVIVCGGIVGWEFLGERLKQDPLTDVRIPIVQGTLNMIQSKPLTGFGLGAWDKAYPEFALFDNGLYTNQAHCDWLQWPAEGGVAMLAIMLLVAISSLRLGIELPWSLGVFFVFVHGLIDYPMQQVPQLATLVMAMLALAAAEKLSIDRRAG